MSEKPKYVAVLKRGIPVDDYATDTLTHIVQDGETVNDLMNWAADRCKGSAIFVSLALTEAQ